MKYCLKCRKKTADVDEPTVKTTKNNRTLAVTRCVECLGKKCYFIKKKLGKGLVNTIIDKLPIELHLPGYQYCGPGTKLTKRLKRGDVGINTLDRACKTHDVAYGQSSDLDKRHEADDVLIKAAQSVRENPDSTWKEKLAATIVKKVMKQKVKQGWGRKKKTK